MVNVISELCYKGQFYKGVIGNDIVIVIFL